MRNAPPDKLSTGIALGAVLLAAFVALIFVALVEATSAASGRNSNLLLGAIGLAGAVGTIVLLGTYLMRSVTQPIRRMADDVKRLGTGDFSTRVPEAGVAELRRLAANLNAMAGSLERAQTDLDRQQAELSGSRTETYRANQAKNEFLSRMSHELRTPLNAILGFAQLMELDDLDARQRDNVAHIVSGGRHLLDLINEVLEISRIEAGTLSPVIEPVHAGTIMQEAIELVGPLATQRRITMKAQAQTHEDLWLAADAQRLKQILLNLLANAVKYNREGGSVTVEVRRMGDRVRILVVDTGMGIPQDQVPKLFIPFERLGAETSGVEGTGLGLVLALRLAEAMNGTLGVQSQPWIGSTFHVELPLAEAPAQVAAEAHAPRLPAAAGVSERSERVRRVLYIEDDVANAQLMAEVFSEEPRLQLITTMQGKLGIELARQHRPDLILLDLHLPDIDGSEVIRRLRIDPITRPIPVIAVSADATQETRTRMSALGAALYLTKPLTLNTVLPAVWEVLESPVTLLRPTEGARQ
jgi:signal transduction histidine kinase/ActR/RegA family two-component response regulator